MTKVFTKASGKINPRDQEQNTDNLKKRGSFLALIKHFVEKSQQVECDEKGVFLVLAQTLEAVWELRV
jgi:hypothetical protein